jgi:hypothetical protein
MALIIHEHRDSLSEEDNNDMSFPANSDLWRLMLANICQEHVDVFEGPVRPWQFNWD